MSVTEECLKALRGLGLTGYEVKAYLSLVQRGGLTASEVSRESQIPYSKVYEVLRSLEKKGWIQSEQSRPSKHYPKPPGEAVETAQLKLRRELESGVKAILRELQPLYEREERRERPDVWIVRGEFNILARIQEVCGRAVYKLQAAVPALSEGLMRVFESTFEEGAGKGLEASFMAVKNADVSLLKRLARYGEVRVREQMFGGGVISDVREVILVLGEDDPAGAVGIWSTHAGLARFAKNYFDHLWREAQPLRAP